MADTPLIDQLAFLQARSQQDEATVLAQALREGIQVLYRQALTEAYLLGQLSREKILGELGPEILG